MSMAGAGPSGVLRRTGANRRLETGPRLLPRYLLGGGGSEKARKLPPLTVNWSDLEIAFERNSPDQESFLDLENGDLLAIIDGEPDAAARRARVAAHPDRFLRV